MEKLENPIRNLKNYLRSKERDHGLKNKNVIIRKHALYGNFIKIDDTLIAIDHWNPKADLIYISHAHMDHIPNIPNKDITKLEKGDSEVGFLCTKITKEIAEHRTREKFTFPESMWLLGKSNKTRESIYFDNLKISLIENGHTYGSRSLLIEGSERILITSDFIGENKYFGKKRTGLRGLEPIKCDYLITECTYGSPKFTFPSFLTLKKRINEYVKTHLTQGFPIIILSYSFGKSQAILNMLECSKKVILERSISNIVEILELNGIDFGNWEPYGNYTKNKLKKKKDYVLLIPPYYMFREPYKTLISSGAKLVLLSGKVISEEYRNKFPVDEYFEYSDHVDFKNLTEFISDCQPKKIVLNHGRIAEFSYFLSNLLENNKNIYFI
jgi:Cft2 family RNA processing exonuclease